MKSNKVILSITALALTVLVAGCKQESKPVEKTEAGTTTEASKGVTKKATDAVKNATAAVKETGAKVIEDVKTAGTTAVAAVTDKAKEMVAPASAKAQELIDSAKSLISEGKFTDALAKLNATSGEPMSTNQVSMVDGLKAQITKATEATSKAVANATATGTTAVSNVTKSATDAVNKFLKP